MPSQWFFLKNFEQSEGLSKLVEIIKIKISKIFADTATKYNKEKELKIPIKRRKVTVSYTHLTLPTMIRV